MHGLLILQQFPGVLKVPLPFSCVFSDTALKEVFTAYMSGHPKQGSLYIDCSTVSPDTIRELDAKAKAAGDPTKVTIT